MSLFEFLFLNTNKAAVYFEPLSFFNEEVENIKMGFAI